MTEIDRMKSKMAKQRNEIARLAQLVENLISQRAKLIEEIEWIKGIKK
tara:strand:+ start:1262 stop:1405 length:144 start_codon:yes stop_codon:yes gene_type:complete